MTRLFETQDGEGSVKEWFEKIVRPNRWTKLCVQKIGDCARREKEQRCWSTVVHRHWSSTSGIGQAGTPVRSRSSSSSLSQQQSVVRRRRRGRLRTHWTVAAAWLVLRAAKARCTSCKRLSCPVGVRGLEQAASERPHQRPARPHSSRGHSCMSDTHEERPWPMLRLAYCSLRHCVSVGIPGIQMPPLPIALLLQKPYGPYLSIRLADSITPRPQRL